MSQVSMTKMFYDVFDFHKKFDLLPKHEGFKVLPEDLLSFRHKFHLEELKEYEDSYNKNLPISIDSLIDLVYVAFGTLIMHGIGSENDVLKLHLLSKASNNLEHTRGLTKSAFNDSMKSLSVLVNKYKKTHDLITKSDVDNNTIPNANLIAGDLGALAVECVWVGLQMVPVDCWDEMWNDVQRANMAKIRVENVEDSTRKSKYDVIKPKGWTAPDSEGILLKYSKNLGLCKCSAEYLEDLIDERFNPEFTKKFNEELTIIKSVDLGDKNVSVLFASDLFEASEQNISYDIEMHKIDDNSYDIKAKKIL